MTLNFGSTSTKTAVYENETELFSKSVDHPRELINELGSINAQRDMRRRTILDFLEENGFPLDKVTCIIARGGEIGPCEAGAYVIDKEMTEFVTHTPVLDHPCNLGPMVGYDLATMLNIPAYTYDTGMTDQFEPIARISGLPDIPRLSLSHCENMRAMAFKMAKQLGKHMDELRLVIAHLGGGITVSAFKGGRMIDVIGDDEGTFAPERMGGMQSTGLIELCFSGKYTQEELMKFIRGKGGMVSYLGTVDAREVEQRIKNGDEKAQLVYDAMAYQVSKDIGALATVLKGDIDCIIITGGIAYSEYFRQKIIDSVKFIAPIQLYPGENELEAFALGGLRVLRGEESVNKFVPPEKVFDI